MPPITGRYVTVQGHRIFLDQVEGGDRGQILCVHTAGMSSLEWRFILPVLGKLGYHMLAPDLPGHGKSLTHHWQAIESIHDYAEILFNLMHSLGLKRPILIGCSIGGDIVLDMAVNHPDDFSAIVCCEAGISNHTFSDDLLERGREDAGIPGFHEMNFYRAATLCGRSTPPSRVQEVQWMRRRGDPKILIHDLLGWNRHDLTESIGRIVCPTLLIKGEDDPAISEEMVERTAQAIRGAELQTLPGVGHFPMVEFDGFADLVAGFLNRHGL